MKKTLFLFASAMMFGGCGMKQSSLTLYTLQAHTIERVPHSSKYRDKSIKVMQPQSLKEKISQKIYFSYSPTLQGSYRNSQWSNDLGKILQGTFIHTLQESGLFKGVVSYASTAQADYRLESTVFDFSHWVRGDASHAVVSIDFALVSTHTGKLVKSKRFSYREATQTINAEGYVEASNRAMERLGRDLLAWLR